MGRADQAHSYLPGLDGFSIVVALRHHNTRLPVDHGTGIHLELQSGSTLDAENEAMD